jgi:hypothetical protein
MPLHVWFVSVHIITVANEAPEASSAFRVERQRRDISRMAAKIW